MPVEQVKPENNLPEVISAFLRQALISNLEITTELDSWFKQFKKQNLSWLQSGMWKHCFTADLLYVIESLSFSLLPRHDFKLVF